MATQKISPFTAAEAATAREQGWQLCDVWCSKRKRVVLELLPADTSQPFRVHTAARLVYMRAKQNDKLAQRALALLMQGQ